MRQSKAERTAAITRSISNGQRLPIASFDSRKYIQHNVRIGDGLAPILAFMDALPPERTRSDVIRAFEDGDYSVVHADYELGDWGPMVGFEVHRWEDDRIVEHWDNLCVTPAMPNASGRTIIGGDTILADADKTEQNRNLIRQFAESVLLTGKLEHVDLFFRDGELIQHSSLYGDGVDAFRQAFTEESNRTKLRYDRIHKILGQGNMFLVISEGVINGEAAALYDLYRVSDDAIAEHWEVFELIPPRSEWLNANGKF